MILALDTDASYLSELGGKIRAAAYYYMTNKGQKYFNNGKIGVLSTIIKHIMSSASEEETGLIYYGCKHTIPYVVVVVCSRSPVRKACPNYEAVWARTGLLL